MTKIINLLDNLVTNEYDVYGRLTCLTNNQKLDWDKDSTFQLATSLLSVELLTFDAIDFAHGLSNFDAIKYDIETSQCFVAGTMVLTIAGSKAIEKIEAGDLVYSTDPETGASEYKEVVQTFENETDELVHISVADDEIVTTPKHPFYVPHKGWTSAIDLRAGDILVLSNGEYVIVEKVQHEILENPVKVYNFEVRDFHTYYVGENPILVHNSCGKQRDIWKSITGEEPQGEVHHGLPTQYEEWFKDRGIDINSGEYYYDLPKDIHRLIDGNGIHTNNSPLGQEWNSIWGEFKTLYPDATKDEIEYLLWKMEREAGISQYRLSNILNMR